MSQGRHDVDAAQRQRWALIVACTATFMLMLDVTVTNIALPMIREEFTASLADQQWVLTAYALPLAAFLLVGGTLGDELGRQRVFVIGLIAFVTSSLIAGVAPNLLTLELARAVQGVGGAILFAISPALIAQEFSAEQRGKAFGLFGAITGLALALGPVAGGILTNFDWRWIFLINVPIGVLLILVCVVKVSNVRPEKRRRIDVTGLTVFSVALAAVVFGIIRSETEGWSNWGVRGLVASGLVLLGAFYLIERSKGDQAMFDVGLLRNRTFLGLSVATFLSNATSLAALFLIVSYVQNILGYSPLQAGLILLPLTVVLFVVAAVVGGLAGKFSPGMLLGVSIGLIGIGIMLLTLVSPGSTWTALLPCLLVMGLGMGMFNPPRSVVTVGVAPPEKAGMASGIGETFQQVGVVAGIATFGALFQHQVITQAGDTNLGRTVSSGNLGQLPQNLQASAREWFVNGLDNTMIICGAICLLGAVIAFALIRSRDMYVAPTEPTPTERAAQNVA